MALARPRPTPPHRPSGPSGTDGRPPVHLLARLQRSRASASPGADVGPSDRLDVAPRGSPPAHPPSASSVPGEASSSSVSLPSSLPPAPALDDEKDHDAPDDAHAPEQEPPPPPQPLPPLRRASASAAFLLSLGLTRPQVAHHCGSLLRLDVRELRAQASKLSARGISAGHAPAAVAACPALLTKEGAGAAAALLAQLGLPRSATGAALAAFPGLLDGLGSLTGPETTTFGGLLAEAVAASSPATPALAALAARPLLEVVAAASAAAPQQRHHPHAPSVVDVRLHPAAAALIAAGARPADVAAIARQAPALLSTRAGRAALDWLWMRGVPAVEVGAAGAAMGAALATHHARLLVELEAAGLRAADGLRLVLTRPRLRSSGRGGRPAARARAAVRAIARAGVPAHAIPGLLLAAPEVLERGLGPGPRALRTAGLTPAEVGAALAACPRLALPSRAGGGVDVRRSLAQLTALGLDGAAVRAVLTSHPAVAATPASALRAVARALVASAIPRRAVPAVLAAAPALLTTGPAGVRSQVSFLASVGVLSGPAAARWPALLDPDAKAQVRFLRARHGLVGARVLGRALSAWPHLHGFGGGGGGGGDGGAVTGGGGGGGGGLRDLAAHLAALGAAGPALEVLLAPGGPPSVPPPARTLLLLLSSPLIDAKMSFSLHHPTTPAGRADATAAAAAAAAGASAPAVALRAAGVPWTGLVVAASLAPALLSPSIALPLAGRLAGLRDGAGLDGEGLGRLLRWSATALADAPPGGLTRALGALADAGVPPALAGRALLSAPGLLLAGGGGGGSGGGAATNPAASLAALRTLGLDTASIAAAVSRCPPLLLHSPSDLLARGAALARWGLAPRALARAAARCPVLLTLPLDRPRYASVAAFLALPPLGLDPAVAIASHPAVLIYSLRNRTGPRAAFLCARWRAAEPGGAAAPVSARPPAVHPATAPLSSWLAMGDADFCERVARAPRAEYEAFRSAWKKRNEAGQE